MRGALLDLGDRQRVLVGMSEADTARPYGRRVLLETDQLEVMVACWTRKTPCAPHTHGGSIGVVQILQGASRHKVWKVTAEGLKLIHEGLVRPPDVLVCGPDLVHSMEDAGDDQPLVTLHMYSHAIDHMLVYDTEAGETLIVDGACGAWIPETGSGFIRDRLLGYHQPHVET